MDSYSFGVAKMMVVDLALKRARVSSVFVQAIPDRPRFRSRFVSRNLFVRASEEVIALCTTALLSFYRAVYLRPC